MQVPMFGTAGFTPSGWALSCWVHRILQVSRVLPAKFPKKSFYMDAAHVALYFGLVPSWWPVFADAGGRNTGTTQILTSIFRANNLQVLLDLSNICHCSCRQLIPRSIFSVKFILYSHLFKVFFLMFELNPYEKNVEMWTPLRLLHHRNINTARKPHWNFEVPQELFYIPHPRLSTTISRYVLWHCQTSKCHVLIQSVSLMNPEPVSGCNAFPGLFCKEIIFQLHKHNFSTTSGWLYICNSLCLSHLIPTYNAKCHTRVQKFHYKYP